MNTILSIPLPILHPSLLIPIEPQRDRAMNLLQGNLGTAAAAQRANREHWATLDLRQQWADAAWMREHLKSAGLIVRNSAEPATVRRLKSLLRSVGVHGPEILDSVGRDLEGFLLLNPNLPLWAALALVLEATGRFTPMSAA